MEMNTSRERGAQVRSGAEVQLEYTLSTEAEIVESTQATGPLRFKVGAGRLHPSIERPLMGLRTGEAFDLVIDPTLGFGEVDQKLIITIAKTKLPTGFRAVDVGSSFEAPGPDGKKRLYRITAADNERITMDANHPLAGQILYLDGRILEVR